jgi:hypothetical protein
MGALGIGPALALRAGAPVVGFDFTTGVLPPGASLARASAATRFDGDGVLAPVAADAARFDHDPVTLALRGLLLEMARTNLFDHADGTVAQLGSSLAVADAPGTLAGFAQAVRLIDNTKGRYAFKHFTHSPGLTYQLSVFVRMDDGGPPLAGAGTGLGDFCMLAGGAVCPASAVIAAGGGLHRVIASYVSAGSDDRFGIAKYTGQSARGVRVSGFQLEQAGDASSLILSGAGGATRAADALTLDWGGLGVGDGTITARMTFDDLTPQDVAMTVAGGTAAVALPINRRRVRRIARV